MNEHIIQAIYHRDFAHIDVPTVLETTIKTAMRAAYRAGYDDAQPLLPLGFASGKQVPPMTETELNEFLDSLGCTRREAVTA